MKHRVCTASHKYQKPKIIRYLPTTNPEGFIRSGLARYANVDAVTERLMERFKLSKDDRRNARKQATELGFCLRQAQEYLDAAEDRTLATKPVLLYYATVSLALAEILWKGEGDHRIEKLRSEHGGHGLEFAGQNVPVNEQAAGARLLCAKMRGPVGKRTGTFGVWHRFARTQQLVGIEREQFLSGQGVASPKVLLMPHDEQIPELPLTGITLLECALKTPTLPDYVRALGLRSRLLRSTMSRTAREVTSGVFDTTLQIEVHPNDEKLVAAFKEQVLADATSLDALEATDFTNHLSISIHRQIPTQAPSYTNFPEGYSVTTTETWFSANDEPLNEFGYFYVALYICGMFARYYPDVWMKHLAASSGLALLVDAVCIAAQDRLSLLLLDELDHMITLPKHVG